MCVFTHIIYKHISIGLRLILFTYCLRKHLTARRLFVYAIDHSIDLYMPTTSKNGRSIYQACLVNRSIFWCEIGLA